MSVKRNGSDGDQCEFWQMAIETWRSSRLSVRQFCRQEGLSEPSFYSWRKRLSGNDNPKEDKQPDCESRQFIEVSMPSVQSGGLELVFTSGNTLKIPADISGKVLANIVSALRQAGLC